MPTRKRQSKYIMRVLRAVHELEVSNPQQQMRAEEKRESSFGRGNHYGGRRRPAQLDAFLQHIRQGSIVTRDSVLRPNSHRKVCYGSESRSLLRSCPWRFV